MSWRIARLAGCILPPVVRAMMWTCGPLRLVWRLDAALTKEPIDSRRGGVGDREVEHERTGGPWSRSRCRGWLRSIGRPGPGVQVLGWWFARPRGSCGSNAPDWGNTAALVECLFFLGRRGKQRRDCRVRSSVCRSRGQHWGRGELELGSVLQVRRATVPARVGTGCRKCSRGANRCAARRRWESRSKRCQMVVLHAPSSCVVRVEGGTASGLVCEVPVCAFE